MDGRGVDGFVIEGARAVLPDGLQTASVRVEGGRIAAIDGPRDGARAIDARGLILAPAIVDVHGDAFERQMMPRPGVLLPVEAAFLDTDRQLAANGIATAYHAVTLGWEPGLRSVATAQAIRAALAALAPRLTVEHRLQLRWETFCPEAIPFVRAALADPLTPALAFNDHTTSSVLHPSVAVQDKPFDHDPGLPVADLDSPAFAARMAGRAARSGMAPPAFVALVRSVWDRRAEVPGWIDAVAKAGRAARAPMLSHDDTQDATRAFFRAQGARIAEFPMNARTARFARAGGDAIVLGAPNAARGGSHLGSVGAAAMIRDGLCDALASDYHYPSMLAAVARLRADGAGPLHALWPLVSGNAARAMGLDDRGRIAPGLRADLILVDWPEGGIPVVRRTWVAGRPAYAAAA